MFKKLINLIRSEEPTKEQKPSDEMLFIDLLREYVARSHRESNFAPGTIKRHTVYLKNINTFLELNGYSGIPLEEVRVKHMEELRIWVMNMLDTKNSSYSSRHAEFCRAAVKYAVRMDYLRYDTLGALQNKRDKAKEIISLEFKELQKLSDYSFGLLPETQRLEKARDLYVFQSWTGLSYSDVYTFKIMERNGRKWIASNRNKNGRPYYVPLFPEAERLIKKYDGNLPLVSNQYYNALLKEIGRVLKLNKRLTTHTARKTFATIRKEEGWSNGSIADMLGNTIGVCETYYLSKNINRVENELSKMNL